MDLEATKRSILERIAKIDDEPRLLALKRWADRQDQYFDREWNVVPPSEAVDSELPMFRVEERNYTAAEVRALLDEVRLTFESDQDAPFLSQAEIAKLLASAGVDHASAGVDDRPRGICERLGRQPDLLDVAFGRGLVTG